MVLDRSRVKVVYTPNPCDRTIVLRRTPNVREVAQTVKTLHRCSTGSRQAEWINRSHSFAPVFGLSQ